MRDSERESAESVDVSVELSGTYGEVVDIIGRADAERRGDLDPLLADLRAVLETVSRIDGGTRSAVVSALPERTTVDFDADEIVPVLRVLQQYDLVALDDNTWVPGPESADD